MQGDRYRIVVEVDEVQYFKLQRYIPWGVRRMLFSCIINDLIEVIEKSKQGDALLGGILSRSIHLFKKDQDRLLGEEKDD